MYECACVHIKEIYVWNTETFLYLQNENYIEIEDKIKAFFWILRVLTLRILQNFKKCWKILRMLLLIDFLKKLNRRRFTHKRLKFNNKNNNKNK